MFSTVESVRALVTDVVEVTELSLRFESVSVDETVPTVVSVVPLGRLLRAETRTAL